MTKKFLCLQITDMIERNDFSYFDVQQKQMDEHTMSIDIFYSKENAVNKQPKIQI